MIHPSSFIDSSAIIADDVTIGAFCHIGKNVILQQGCIIASHVILNDNVTCKSNVKIFSYVHLGNHLAHIEIGENTHIREFSLVGTDDNDSKDVMIENDNFIMAYVRVSNGVTIEHNCILTNSVTMNKNVTCKNRVTVGGLSTIESNISIGSGVMRGGASYITKDMPPFTLVEGNIAKIRGLNMSGLRRRLRDTKKIDEIKSAYRAVFRHGLDKQEAKKIRKNTDNQYVKEFCDFILDKNI